MSSFSIRRPEFRLHLGYPDIILTSGKRTLGRVAAEAAGLRAALARLTDPVRRARGRLVVVLPESEVWRGRVDLAGRSRAERRASARSIVAGRLAEAPGDIVVVLGTRETGGSFPVAGVRRSTLHETRALLAGLGLRPGAIVGAGLFPGFLTAPRLVGPSLPMPALPMSALPARQRGLGAALGAGAVVSLAILALGMPGPDALRPAEALAPVPAVVAEAEALELPPAAQVVLPPPPPVLALASSERPRPRPATVLGEPTVTVAARNMPADLPIVIDPPSPSPARRLAELTAAPARVLDGITAPLRRPEARSAAPPEARSAAAAEREIPEIARTAMPVLPAPAVATDLRPMHRPKLEPAAATPAAAAAAPAAASAALAPPPRAQSGSAEPALLVASLEPAPLMQASIAAATAAAVAAAVAEPPPARPAAIAAKPAATKPAPVVVRPKPVAAAPAPVQPPVRQLVKQATPQRQVVVASANPRRAVVAAAPAAKPAPVRQKVVAKPVRKPVPVKTVPVRQAAKQVRQAAPQPVAAVAPMVTAKPAKQRPATQRVGLSRGNISLVGVFGGADGRHALVRLPNGNIERVKAGDRVHGVQVAAISADSVRLTGRGKDTLLRLPD